jgi:hypothetical protein
MRGCSEDGWRRARRSGAGAEARAKLGGALEMWMEVSGGREDCVSHERGGGEGSGAEPTTHRAYVSSSLLAAATEAMEEAEKRALAWQADLAAHTTAAAAAPAHPRASVAWARAGGQGSAPSRSIAPFRRRPSTPPPAPGKPATYAPAPAPPRPPFHALGTLSPAPKPKVADAG